MWGFGPVLPVGLGLVVPPLVITFELAFLITLLTVFNVVELLVAHIDLGVFNENVPLNIFPTVAGNRRRYRGCAKEGKRGDRRLETTPVVCLLRQPLTYVRYILASNAVHITGSRFRNNEVYPWRQLFTTHRVWYVTYRTTKKDDQTYI